MATTEMLSHSAPAQLLGELDQLGDRLGERLDEQRVQHLARRERAPEAVGAQEHDVVLARGARSPAGSMLRRL